MICESDGRFHYVHPTQRLGLSSSLNLAISMARGELLARFDSDDVCAPERLAIQVAFLEKLTPDDTKSVMELYNKVFGV